MTTQQTVKIQLVRSPIGTKESHRATVRGLGLRKLNSVSELKSAWHTIGAARLCVAAASMDPASTADPTRRRRDGAAFRSGPMSTH